MDNNIENSPLRALFWKDEILQVMYWIKGEGLGEKLTAAKVLALLPTNPENLSYHLEKLVKEGYLEKDGSVAASVYCLSKMGNKEAGKRFSEAFQGLQKAGHGECGPDCEFCYGPDGIKLENCVHNCANESNAV